MSNASPAHPHVLDQLAHTLGSARTAEDLVRPLLELLCTITKLESTYLTAIDPAETRLRVQFAHNTGTLDITETMALDWTESLCKRALDEAARYTDAVPERWGDLPIVRTLGIQSHLSAPVRLTDGELYGMLCGASRRKVAMDANGRRAAAIFAHLIGQHIEHDRLLRKLRQANAALKRSAHEDPLTGLPNRRAVIDALTRRLAQHDRNGGNLLAAFIDLDGFKHINDRYGHQIGDAFLAAVAKQLTVNLRAGDMVGRIGGDEFLLLASVADGQSAAASAALQIRLDDCLRRQFRLGAIQIAYSGASVGIVSASPGETAAGLIARADAAMYMVKQKRRAQMIEAQADTQHAAWNR